LLDLVSAKWTVQILRELALGPVRTKYFLRVIPGMTMKTLQERLKALLAEGMITRQVFNERLLRVEYSITERGRRLFNVMNELKAIASESAAAQSTACHCKCSLEGYGAGDMDCPCRTPSPGSSIKRQAS
jgi:DNA-binding HxlR family transcriptional regulator